MVTARREEVRALRAAWSQLKNALYREKLVTEFGELRNSLRELETLMITAPGSGNVSADIRSIRIFIRESEAIGADVRTRLTGRLQVLDHALEAISGLPDGGSSSLREDLTAMQQALPPGLPLSPTQDPAISAYRRDPDAGEHDHPINITTNVWFLIRLTSQTEGLDTEDIAEQLRDIALQLNCESPSVPTLQYMTRKLYLSMRSKVDLSELKNVPVSFELSQLMGAVMHLPPQIPSPFRIDLKATSAALSRRNRSTSTPARPAAGMPAQLAAWMALRKTLRTDTHINKKTVGELMQLFSAAANKPLAARKPALDQAREALHLALRNSDAIDSNQAKALRAVLESYCQPLLAAQQAMQSPTAAQQQQQQQHSTGVGAHSMPAREQAMPIRNLVTDFAAVDSGWDPFASDSSSGQPAKTGQ